MAQGKRVIPPYVLVQNADASANITTNPFSLELFDRATLHIMFVGTMSGTVTVQGSSTFIPPNKTLSPNVTPAVWYDIPLTLVNVPGADQDYVIDFTETGLPWIRINYVAIAGAGTMTVVITGKES